MDRGNEIEEVINFLLCPYFPRLVSRHALLTFHQVQHFFGDDTSVNDIGTACLVHVMKVHNNTDYSLLKCAYGLCECKEDVIPLQLCITQLVRTKPILVESCLRIKFQRLMWCNSSLFWERKHIIRVALALTDKVYRTKFCLYPSTAAAACLLHACFLLGLEVHEFPWKNKVHIKVIQYYVFS